MLTLKERNEVFEAVAASGLNPAQFTLTDDEDGCRIRNGPTVSASFFFRESGGTYYYGFRVPDGPDTGKTPYLATSWPELTQAIGDWAGEVKYVATTPDLWAQVGSVPELTTLEAATENAPFTPEQQAELAARLDRVMDSLSADAASLGLQAGHLEDIEQDLDELKQASRRVGAKDWRVMVYGYAVGWIAHGVSSAAVGTAVPMILHAVGHVLGTPGAPPPALPSG